jgi:heme-degrading monooxygenase HmoA
MRMQNQNRESDALAASAPSSAASPSPAGTVESNQPFVALSRFTVANGMEDAVREAFRSRPHLVDRAEGFLRMEVLNPVDTPQEFWLMTWWSSQAAYSAWHRGHDYHASHKGIPKGLKLVPGLTSITLLQNVAS